MSKLLLVLALAVCVALPIKADEIYSFAGPSYTVYDSPGTCQDQFFCNPHPAHITGSFTTNLSLIGLNDYSIPGQDITAYSFTDNNGVTATEGGSFSFIVTTDEQGNIVGPDWSFWAGGPSGELGADPRGEEWSMSDMSYGQTSFEPIDPGIWTASDPLTSHAPVPTPEPSTFVLFAAAGSGFLVLRAKERRVVRARRIGLRRGGSGLD